jgi:hypothetical protein
MDLDWYELEKTLENQMQKIQKSLQKKKKQALHEKMEPM